MKPVIPMLLILLAGSVAPCSHGEERAARRLAVREAAFDKLEVAATKSMPPQFVVTLERDMPTPGWTLVVDELDVVDGRIVAKVTEAGPPRGMVAQVITPTPLRLSVGELTAGQYVLEIWLRRGKAGEYRPAQLWVLVAT